MIVALIFHIHMTLYSLVGANIVRTAEATGLGVIEKGIYVFAMCRWFAKNCLCVLYFVCRVSGITAMPILEDMARDFNREMITCRAFVIIKQFWKRITGSDKDSVSEPGVFLIPVDESNNIWWVAYCVIVHYVFWNNVNFWDSTRLDGEEALEQEQVAASGPGINAEDFTLDTEEDSVSGVTQASELRDELGTIIRKPKPSVVNSTPLTAIM